jgi:hypothetical protein
MNRMLVPDNIFNHVLMHLLGVGCACMLLMTDAPRCSQWLGGRLSKPAPMPREMVSSIAKQVESKSRAVGGAKAKL